MLHNHCFIKVIKCVRVAEIQNHENPPKLCLYLVATRSTFSSVPTNWCISLRKCFDNQNVLSLKSFNIDFLKIPEIVILDDTHFFTPKNVPLKCFPLYWESEIEKRF